MLIIAHDDKLNIKHHTEINCRMQCVMQKNLYLEPLNW